MAARTYDIPVPVSKDPAERMRFYAEQLNALDAQRNRVAVEMMIAQAELSAQRAAGIGGGQLLTVPEAAARLGLGKTTVYELMASGRLPRVTLEGSRSVRIEARAVDEYIATCKGTRGGAA